MMAPIQATVVDFGRILAFARPFGPIFSQQNFPSLAKIVIGMALDGPMSALLHLRFSSRAFPLYDDGFRHHTEILFGMADGYLSSAGLLPVWKLRATIDRLSSGFFDGAMPRIRRCKSPSSPVWQNVLLADDRVFFLT